MGIEIVASASRQFYFLPPFPFGKLNLFVSPIVLS